MGAYTHGHHESVLRSHTWRTAENSAAYLLPHLRAGQSLLDVGCGPATITADLARLVAPGSVVGIDPSAEVIERARAEHPGLDLRVGDLFELADGDLADGRFDVVHAHQVLQHLDDPVGALRAMAALTADGGVVAVRDSDYPAFLWTGGDERLHRWLDVYLQVTRRNGANADAGRHLLRWAREAGLDDVTYSTSTWTYATSEERAWWADLWATRTVQSDLARQAVAYGIATDAELADIAEGWQAWGRTDDAVFVVLHGELLALP